MRLYGGRADVTVMPEFVRLLQYKSLFLVISVCRGVLDRLPLFPQHPTSGRRCRLSSVSRPSFLQVQTLLAVPADGDF